MSAKPFKDFWKHFNEVIRLAIPDPWINLHIIKTNIPSGITQE